MLDTSVETGRRESISQFVKPGLTFFDVLKKAQLNGIELNGSPTSNAIALLSEWRQKHTTQDVHKFQSELVAAKLQGSYTQELPVEEIHMDENTYYVKGILHPDTTKSTLDQIYSSPTWKRLSLQIQNEVINDMFTFDRHVFVEQNLKEILRLHPNTEEIPDLTAFIHNPEVNKKIDAYMRTDEFKARMRSSGFGAYIDSYQVPDADLSIKAEILQAVIQKSKARDYFLVDTLNLSEHSSQLYNHQYEKHTGILQQELQSCKSIGEFSGLMYYVHSRDIPEPLNMELHFMIAKPSNSPDYSYQDILVDRSIFQTKQLKKRMAELHTRKSTLYVGAAHLWENKWLIEHPQYDLRQSIGHARGVFI